MENEGIWRQFTLYHFNVNDMGGRATKRSIIHSLINLINFKNLTSNMTEKLFLWVEIKTNYMRCSEFNADGWVGG